MRAHEPSNFKVGDRALYFYYDDGKAFQKVTVVEGYRMHAVITEEDRTGNVKWEYRYGYGIRPDGSQDTFFTRGHKLTRLDGKPSHFKVVKSPAFYVFMATLLSDKKLSLVKGEHP